MKEYFFNERALKMLMADRNINQTEFAAAIGVSKSSVCRWCKGVDIPKQDKIAQICNVLKCRLSDIYIDYKRLSNGTPYERLCEQVKVAATELNTEQKIELIRLLV